MKRYIIINILVVFFISSVMAVQQLYCSKYSVVSEALRKILKTTPAKDLKLLAKNIKKSGLYKELTNKKILQGIPKVKINPTTLKIAAALEKIASKGKFGKNILKYSDNPADVVRFYSKYGDDFIKVGEKVKNTVSKLDFKALDKSSLKLPKGVIFEVKKLKDPKTFSNKYTEFLKKAGKYGFEKLKKLLTLAKNNKIKTGAGVIIASFIVAPDKTGAIVENVFERVGRTAGKIITAPTTGLIKGIFHEMFSSGFSFIILVGVIIIVILVFPIKKIILLPFNVAKGKLEQKIDEIEKKALEKKSEKENTNKKNVSSSVKKGDSNNEEDETIL